MTRDAQPIEERRAREILAFVSQPLYKDDGKSFHRRYNLMECKISTADSKRHDRRWESVESWMDGSFTAVMGLTKDFRPFGNTRIVGVAGIRVSGNTIRHV